MSKKKLKRTIKLLEKELLWYDEKLTRAREHFKEATGKNYHDWLVGTWLDKEEPAEASGEVLGAWSYNPPYEGAIIPLTVIKNGEVVNSISINTTAADTSNASLSVGHTTSAPIDVFEGAPDWANYWAQDASGMCVWYANRPSPQIDSCWASLGQEMSIGERPRLIDWTETLVARPKKENPSEEGFLMLHRYEPVLPSVPGSFD